MNAIDARKLFRLTLIAPFDARRGYTRCDPPGVGISVGSSNPLCADSDFWRSRTGSFVVRISSKGYVYHLEALHTSGEQIHQDDMGDVVDYIADVLYEWVREGYLDEVPSDLNEKPLGEND